MSIKLYSFKWDPQCHATSMLKSELQAYRVAGAFFRVADEMRRLTAYFDNPG